MQRNLNRTISQLLHQKWNGPVPTSNDSYIRQTLYRLYNTAISDLDIEDIRFLINQEILLDDIMPLAVEQLQSNILAEGDFYEGDLLNAALSVGSEFWSKHPALKETLKKTIRNHMWEIEAAGLPRQVGRNIESFLSDAQ